MTDDYIKTKFLEYLDWFIMNLQEIRSLSCRYETVWLPERPIILKKQQMANIQTFC
jgi:hypothetical protein